MSTVYDVADLAGVSTATVSRVIHGSPLVRPDTQQRVRAAIEVLGFVPDGSAQGLSRRRKDIIGLAALERGTDEIDIEEAGQLFVDEIVHAVEAVLRASGDYLEYPGINFGTGSSQFDARVASGAAGGVSGLVEVVLDNPSNAPIGSFAVANTGGWASWRTVPANITKVTGTHNVYLEFSSGATGGPPYVSLHYFSFPVS